MPTCSRRCFFEHLASDYGCCMVQAGQPDNSLCTAFRRRLSPHRRYLGLCMGPVRHAHRYSLGQVSSNIFFSNVIGSFLHVVTATGTDELQIFRLALSNVLSLLLVILLAKHKKISRPGRRQRSMKSMPSNAVRRTVPGPSNAGQRSKGFNSPHAGKASKPGRRKRRGQS